MDNIKKEKAVVLLSGGIDSTTCLALAVNKFGAENVMALSLLYGQKHDKEVECAQAVADFYKVPLYMKDLSTVFEYSQCTLLKGREDMVHKSYSEQLAEMGGSGTVSTYVPFRNGMFLSSATSIALSLGASVIYYGAHSDDAAGSAYPDCTEEFAHAMNEAISSGTGYEVRLDAPLLAKNKADVISIGHYLGAPYHLTWSCYEGRNKQCGTCGTCIDRRKAFELNGLIDPVSYEV